MSEISHRHLAAAALASLPGISPARLSALLALWPDPIDAADAVLAGRGARALAESIDDRVAIGERWRTSIDLERTKWALDARNTRVLVSTDSDFPIGENEASRPPVLFCEGSAPQCLDAPRVAIVGTRAATPHGLADAGEIGAFLAKSGVTVVSGLAIGIDGAAHVGALDAGGFAVGVLAHGLDIVYPKRHLGLFGRVRDQGVLITESALGVTPEPGRFPVRNRIIAGLADVVVVIEATIKGGTRITAERALDYGRPVFALPGSRRNPAAAGCNFLIADGASPLIDPSDILLALGMTPGSRRGWGPRTPSRSPLSSGAAQLLKALGGEPASTDELLVKSRLDPTGLVSALSELERTGRVARQSGQYWPK